MNFIMIDTKVSVKMHSSLPRSNNRLTTNVSQTVPDMNSTASVQAAHGTWSSQPGPTGSTTSPGNNKTKSSTSMIDKFKLFATKNRTDNGNCSSGLSPVDPLVDITSKTSQQGNASSPGDCRAPRLSVRNDRDTGVRDTGQNDGLSGLPPGGARNNSTISSIGTPSKTSKVYTGDV